MRKILLLVFFLIGCSKNGTSPIPSDITNLVCLDNNALNYSSTGNCECQSNYTLNQSTNTCEQTSGETDTQYTYESVYTEYSPILSETIPCQGQVIQEREKTCKRSDNIFVSNSFCGGEDSEPQKIINSIAGSFEVNKTNPNLSNGKEYMTCQSGATTGQRSIVCNNGYVLTGTSIENQQCVATGYIATYSNYSPNQDQTVPCQGQVQTSRTIISCRRTIDNVLVQNSFCSDSRPTSTVLSKMGSILVVSTNPNLVNGHQERFCQTGQTTGLDSISCNSGYHMEGTSLNDINCYSNIRSCQVLPSGVSAGQETWIGTSYSSCVATACQQGFTLQSGQCLSSNSSQNKLSMHKGSVFQIMNDGSLKAWGANESAQLGVNDQNNKYSPVTVNLGTGRTIKKLVRSGIGDSTCAILDDSSVKCWGSNSFYQIGDGTNLVKKTPQLVNLGSGRTAKDIVSSMNSFCAILDNDSLKCWGQNESGELGVGSNNYVSIPTTINLGTGRTIRKIYMNSKVSTGSYSCAILDDNSLKCWGKNTYGQLGIGSTTDQYYPQSVNLGNGRTVKEVFIGSDLSYESRFSTCAILDNDSLKCWGYNANGRLGIGNTTDQTNPQSVNLGTNRTVKKFYMSRQGFNCAILDNDSVKCWGKNNMGQIGDGSNTDRTTPVQINFPSQKSVKELFLDQLNVNFAIHSDNSVSSWGDNYRGQLGLNNQNMNLFSPTDVNINKTVLTVSISSYLSCLKTNDNYIKCSGDNTKGSLGNTNFPNNSYSFVDVNLGSGRTVKEIVSENYTVCALLDNDSVKCWGWNEKGRTGTGSSNSNIYEPTQVSY